MRIRLASLFSGLFIIVVLGLVGREWMEGAVDPQWITYDVDKVILLPWLETRYAYACLHFFTFLPVFALSFDRKVHYYRAWRFLLPAIAIIGSAFIAWDVFFTRLGVWGFNEAYFLGWRFLYLPLEEWLFFFTVPFACLFIYECLNAYVQRDWLKPAQRSITTLLILLFTTVGCLFLDRLYTATTFLLSAALLVLHLFWLRSAYLSRFYFAYIVSWLPFLVVNGVLTGGYTEAPIVVYNRLEFTGIRLSSVPIDDSVYSFLLLLGVTTLYETFRRKKGSA